MHGSSLCLPIVLLLAPCGATHSNLANATDTMSSWDHSAHEWSSSTEYSAAGVVITLMLVAGVVACCCVALQCDANCASWDGMGLARWSPYGQACQCGGRGQCQCGHRNTQYQTEHLINVAVDKGVIESANTADDARAIAAILRNARS